MNLLNSTKSTVADRAIAAALDVVQSKFPKPLLSAYVTGSYANGYAIESSDVDLFLVFAECLTSADEALAEVLTASLGHLEPPIDIAFQGLPDLIKSGEVGMKTHFLHVFGEPVHQMVSNPPMEDYSYQRMHGAFNRMRWTRKSKPYVCPLSFPDNTKPYKGYEWRTSVLAGVEVPSIKEIVVLTGWMATGLSAWQGRTYIPNKSECPKIFRSVVGGQAAADFQEITDVCRTRFKYLIPESEKGKQELKDLLPRVLAFENFFLEQYQYFLILNLHSHDPSRIRTGLVRLGEVIFPNDLSLNALNEFLPSDELQRVAVEKTIAVLTSFRP